VYFSYDGDLIIAPVIANLLKANVIDVMINTQRLVKIGNDKDPDNIGSDLAFPWLNQDIQTLKLQDKLILLRYMIKEKWKWDWIGYLKGDSKKLIQINKKARDTFLKLTNLKTVKPEALKAIYIEPLAHISKRMDVWKSKLKVKQDLLDKWNLDLKLKPKALMTYHHSYKYGLYDVRSQILEKYGIKRMGDSPHLVYCGSLWNTNLGLHILGIKPTYINSKNTIKAHLANKIFNATCWFNKDLFLLDSIFKDFDNKSKVNERIKIFTNWDAVKNATGNIKNNKEIVFLSANIERLDYLWNNINKIYSMTEKMDWTPQKLLVTPKKIFRTVRKI